MTLDVAAAQLERCTERLEPLQVHVDGPLAEVVAARHGKCDAPEPAEGYNPVVIAETKKNIRTLSVSDAVLDLDMTGAPVLLFRHAGSGRINLVYRRTDGHIGWVDPPAADH